jgi:hypothetical protein
MGEEKNAEQHVVHEGEGEAAIVGVECHYLEPQIQKKWILCVCNVKFRYRDLNKHIRGVPV